MTERQCRKQKRSAAFLATVSHVLGMRGASPSPEASDGHGPPCTAVGTKLAPVTSQWQPIWLQYWLPLALGLTRAYVENIL